LHAAVTNIETTIINDVETTTTTTTTTTNEELTTFKQQERNMVIQGLNEKVLAEAIVEKTKEMIEDGFKKLQLSLFNFHDYSKKMYEKLKVTVKPKFEAARDQLCNPDDNDDKSEDVDDDEVRLEEDDGSRMMEIFGFFKNNFLTKRLCTYGKKTKEATTTVRN
jgi:hypothetical protein